MSEFKRLVELILSEYYADLNAKKQLIQLINPKNEPMNKQ